MSPYPFIRQILGKFICRSTPLVVPTFASFVQCLRCSLRHVLSLLCCLPLSASTLPWLVLVPAGRGKRFFVLLFHTTVRPTIKRLVHIDGLWPCCASYWSIEIITINYYVSKCTIRRTTWCDSDYEDQNIRVTNWIKFIEQLQWDVMLEGDFPGSKIKRHLWVGTCHGQVGNNTNHVTEIMNVILSSIPLCMEVS